MATPPSLAGRRLRLALDAYVKLRVVPHLIAFCVRRVLLGPDRAYLDLSERAAGWAGVVGQHMRAAAHRGMGSRLGPNTVLSYGVVLERPPLSVGDMTMLGHYSNVQNAEIGRDCLIGDYVLVVDGTGQHASARLDVPLNAQGGIVRRVTIGDDTMIGGHAWIAADVGSHCIVGAGSVVTRPVPDYKIVAGVPARIIGDRRERADS
ncbi:MAG: acyltransferase [Solirubrobacteraceae bacterium]